MPAVLSRKERGAKCEAIHLAAHRHATALAECLLYIERNIDDAPSEIGAAGILQFF